MARHLVNKPELDTPIVEVSKIDCPSTTVLNRAQMVDLSQDLGVRFGIERYQIQELIDLPAEIGPSGEPVYKPINDWEDAVRVYGDYSLENGTRGPNLWLLKTADYQGYLEISFYGTGLNLLYAFTGPSRSLQVEVDGGSASTLASPGGSTILDSRNYSINAPVSVISGLSLGLHTVRVYPDTDNVLLNGYEVVNESTDLLITKGSSSKGEITSNMTISYDDTDAFDAGSDVLGSKGGRVLVYQKGNQVYKRLKAVDITAKYLTNTDHSNEEVIRHYFMREFGASRTDDLSGNWSGDNSFSLDDGTASVTVEDYGAEVSTARGDRSWAGAAGDYITLTFIGTGLDLDASCSGAGSHTITAYINGASQGTFQLTSQANKTIFPICSGLPYGTHVVRLEVSANGASAMEMGNFIVYGPKKPELPENAIELAEYYLMADFAANSTVGPLNIATGVLRKTSLREVVYGGAPSGPGLNTGCIGWYTNIGSVNDEVEYTFFGTGFDLRFRTTADGPGNNIELTVDGSHPTATAYGGHSYSGTGTGLITGTTTDWDGGLYVEGLTLGLHTIKLHQNNTGTNCFFTAIDIICPVHYPKNNGPYVLQDTISIGSCAIGDLRKFDKDVVESRNETSFVQGIRGTYTQSKSPQWIISDMKTTYYADEDQEVIVSGHFRVATAPSDVEIWLFINGHRYKAPSSYTSLSSWNQVSFSFPVVLKKGYHFLGAYASDGNQIGSNDRSFKVTRIGKK